MTLEEAYKKRRVPIEVAVYAQEENLDMILRTLKRFHYLEPKTSQEPYWKIIKLGDCWVDVSVFIRDSVPFEETADIIFLDEDLPSWIESYYRYCYKKCGAPLITPDFNREFKKILTKIFKEKGEIRE